LTLGTESRIVSFFRFWRRFRRMSVWSCGRSHATAQARAARSWPCRGADARRRRGALPLAHRALVRFERCRSASRSMASRSTPPRARRALCPAWWTSPTSRDAGPIAHGLHSSSERSGSTCCSVRGARDACACSRWSPPKSITRYLCALGQPTDAPTRAPARGPPYWKSRVLRGARRAASADEAAA